MIETTSGKANVERRLVSVEEIEDIVVDVLDEKKLSLSKEERDILVQKVISKTDRHTVYVRYRNARKLREAKKRSQEKAAQLASSFALSVGSSAAAGLAAAIAVPSAPIIAVAGAIAGLVGAWVIGHQSGDTKQDDKKSRQ